MNAVEIEEAISELSNHPFNHKEFPYQFLIAFGNKSTTIKKLRSGITNKSDLGGVLQRNNIHICTCINGEELSEKLFSLKESKATINSNVKFIVATDGNTLEAEDLITGETISCKYSNLSDYFGFFLPLAGITTVQQIRENSFDIKATSRLNKLYLELIKDNPKWSTKEMKVNLNHFLARLIFCFFAEDTDIFGPNLSFTKTIEQMSSGNTNETNNIISEIFRSMNTPFQDKQDNSFPSWSKKFPYVNGGLFSGDLEVPFFSRISRSYLIHIGNLDWQKINPDIFGSMIQAVSEADERGSLGMHYTSVPNILKVLDPLFLDDIREQLNEAGDNRIKLLNIKKRISKIRVFDPACGSGNFLVIAYKKLREIEAEINAKRREENNRSIIPLTNFRGIEIRGFSAELARLALIIAEYQCNLQYIGQKEALDEFLPLNEENWITTGNALRLNWLDICPPTGKKVEIIPNNLFDSMHGKAEIDFQNEGGETFICGNPPYVGSSFQTSDQKSDLKELFSRRTSNFKNLDYISGWFIKASDQIEITGGAFAFVSTNSISQGQLVPLLWPLILNDIKTIFFAHLSFKWSNLAKNNAGVTVVVIGITTNPKTKKRIFSLNKNNEIEVRNVNYINAYLVPGKELIIQPRREPFNGLGKMLKGNQPSDGGHLCLSSEEAKKLIKESPNANTFLKKYVGSADFIRGINRYCLWIDDSKVEDARKINDINNRLNQVAEMRRNAKAKTTRPAASWPHRFIQIQSVGNISSIIVPRVSSERREYLPVGLLDSNSIVSDSAQAIYDAPLWNLSIIASKIHLTWIATVCGKLKTDFRYSNTLGWNTFPIPKLTQNNISDLTTSAENILLTREAYFPKTISELYDPEIMPEDLQKVHKVNDEIIERIYIGRKFVNDTERLEKLFELYNKLNKEETKNIKDNKNF